MLVDVPQTDDPPETWEGNPLFALLPERFQWTVHNLIAHPWSEVLYQLGFEDASNRVHDWTIPLHKTGDGRG